MIKGLREPKVVPKERQEESHFAHEGAHMTEVVKDYVSHAGGQQEICRRPSTVTVPPPRA